MGSEPDPGRYKAAGRSARATWQKKVISSEQQIRQQNVSAPDASSFGSTDTNSMATDENSVADHNFSQSGLTDQSQIDKIAEERAEAQSRIDEWVLHRQELLRCRQQNLSAWNNRSTSSMKNLDSSIKKTSAFLRKLRSFSLGGETHVKNLLTDLEKLNLSRYGTEMVNAIVETRLARSVDVSWAVQISGAIHRIYPQFASDLESSLAHVFDGVAQYSKRADIDKEQASRWRSTLKLVTDLFRYGVFKTPKLSASAIKQLIECDQGCDPNCTVLSILVGFCRYAGYDFLGVLPVKLEADFLLCGQSPQSTFSQPEDNPIDQETREKCQIYFIRYFDVLSARFCSLIREVNRQKNENKRQLFYKGTVDEKHIAHLDALTEKLESLKLHLSQFADLIRREMPEVKIEEKDESGKVVLDDGTSAAANTNILFDDEETAAFYSSFPDLSAIIPAVLLGDGKSDSSQPEAVVIDEKTLQDECSSSELKQLPSKQLSPFDLFLQNLPEAMNRSQIDEMAEQFCHLNNRGTRKRLIENLYLVSRDRLDLLPYYSRLVAILTPCFPDVGSELVRLLKSQFYGLMRNKSQHNIESKVKNVRYIGELIKFGVAHHSVAFNAWNFCMNEFSGQRINVCCALLESCGRWLFKNPETNERCSQFLDRMMKLKAAKYMEEHMSNMVENAYYHCNPPPVRVRRRKVYPPMRLYLHQLIYTELNDSTVDDILILLRKLPWNNADVVRWVKTTLIRADRVQVQNIKCLASIVAGIDKFHSIAIEIADVVLEDIRQGLENNNFVESQRRLAFARYLGELYNYMIVNAQTIFDTLYMIITLGHEIDRNGHLVSQIDPPTDTFRVRIVCVILDSCGSYFSGGSKKKRLDRFFLFLQRYLMLKSVVPADIDFLVADVFDALSPQLPRYTSLTDVNDAIARMDKNNVDRLVQLCGPGQSDRKIMPPDIDEIRASDEERDQIKAAAVESDDAASLDESEVGIDDEIDDFNRWSQKRDSSCRSTDDNKAFDLEFERLVLESVEQRKFEKRTIQSLTDAATFSVKAKPSVKTDEDKVVFQLLTRKSNKPQTKALAIPTDVGLAAKSIQEKKNAAEEQNALRELVMAGMQREAEEQQRDGHGTSSELDRHISVDLSYRNFDRKSTAGSQQSSNRQRAARGFANGRRLLGRSAPSSGSLNGGIAR